MAKNIIDLFKEGPLEYVFLYLLLTIIIGLFLYVRNGLDKLDSEKKEKKYY